MSIIHEALKKIQHDRYPTHVNPTENFSITQIVESPPPRRRKTISLIYVLSLTLPLVILLALFLSLKNNASPLPRVALPETLTPSGSPDENSFEKNIAPQAKTQGNVTLKSGILPFELSGISYDGIDSIAIINGKIFTTGAHLDGAILKTIMKDRVILSVGSSDVVLKLTHD